VQDPTDLELLHACIAGDRRAWEIFVQRFTRYVWYLVDATGKRYDASLSADDLADYHNDVFVALLENDRHRLRQFQGKNGCSVRSWIRVITIRRTVDALRRRRAHLQLDPEPTDDRAPMRQLVDASPDPLESLITAQGQRRGAQLNQLIEHLSVSDRLLLQLLYQQKLSVDATAAALKIKRGALYTRKTRIIKRLRALATEAGLIAS
jgi:RNA polymerase sigma factor (sigma-70 family)